MDISTDLVLQSVCTEWQKLLRLQDWDITATFARSREMVHEGKHLWGKADLSYEHRYAEISILHPDDCDSDEERGEIETTLVHELLHIYFTPVRGETPDVLAEEQAINSLSTLLVRLQRKNQ